jgi:nitroimidazol reductase NimA-like FMN-containing flavoprotein (pyridoxamine 5'-phosphate oxidase superfamily)
VTNDDIARAILDAGIYVVLATADADGVPWASPVWFAKEGYRELYWVSYPGARHSQNIAVRPQIAMVVFDSTVPPGTGQGVYMTATAEHLTDPAAIEHGIGVFSRESVRDGDEEEWGADQVTGEARLRLYD